MTRIISIFERLGLGGGGKIKAVYRRMNMFSEDPEFHPVLMVMDHHVRYRINFSELQDSGDIARRVAMMTLIEASTEAVPDRELAGLVWPRHDEIIGRERETAHMADGEPAMTERSRDTSIGNITKRVLFDRRSEIETTFINGVQFQRSRKTTDGHLETIDFSNGMPIRWTRRNGKNFVAGRNLITGKLYRAPRAFDMSFIETMCWENSVVFFDGITSAYLASAVKAPRALFLHADHRSPKGEIVPRSKFLIENFSGEAIITSTEAHKRQMKKDLVPSAEVHVIPHVCDVAPGRPAARRDLVTVSRLDLSGKPIDECVAAFAEIANEFPDVDYLIYGEGSGREKLTHQIHTLGMSNRVKLLGYTTAPLEVFRDATASIYPTRTEGFGLSILEALSCGCPVISYDVNYGPRELIKPGKNGELTLPGDIIAIADAMRHVLNDPEKYQHGTSQRLDKYTREAYVKNYKSVVNNLRSGSTTRT